MQKHFKLWAPLDLSVATGKVVLTTENMVTKPLVANKSFFNICDLDNYLQIIRITLAKLARFDLT